MRANNRPGEELWHDVADQLERQRKPSDGNWVNFLNRMFAERAREAGISHAPRLGRHNCSVCTETWKPAELYAAAVLHHDRDRPVSQRRPVFVRHRGKLLIIDGNNRVVKWAKERGEVPCEIIVIVYAPAESPTEAAMKVKARVELKEGNATRVVGEMDWPRTAQLGHDITVPIDHRPTRVTVLQVIELLPWSAERPLVIVKRAKAAQD